MLLADELYQGRDQHVVDKPRIIVSLKSGRDVGSGHFETKIGQPVAHDADSLRGERGCNLSSVNVYVYTSVTTVNAHRYDVEKKEFRWLVAS